MGLTIGGRDYSGITAMTLSSAFAQAQAQQRAARAAAAQQGVENSQKQFGLDTDRTKVTGDLQNTAQANANTANGQVLDYLGKIRVAAAGGQFDAAKTLLGQLSDISQHLDPETARSVLAYGSNLIAGGNSALGGGAGSSDLANYASGGQQKSPDFTAKPITAGVGMQNMTLQQAAAMAPQPTPPQSPLQQSAAQAPPTSGPTPSAPPAGSPFDSVPFKPSPLVASQTGKNWADAAASASAGNKSDADAGAALQKTATDAYTALAGLTNPDGSPNVAAQNNMVDQINGANPNVVLPHVKADGSNAYKMDLGTFANIQKTFAEATGARVGAYKTAAEAGQVAPNAASDRLKADREGRAAMLNASTNFKQFGLDQQKFIMDDPVMSTEIQRMDALDTGISQANERKDLAIRGYTADANGGMIPIDANKVKAITTGEDANIHELQAQKQSVRNFINARIKQRTTAPAGVGKDIPGGEPELEAVPMLPGFSQTPPGKPGSVAPGAYEKMRPIDRVNALKKQMGGK